MVQGLFQVVSTTELLLRHMTSLLHRITELAFIMLWPQRHDLENVVS